MKWVWNTYDPNKEDAPRYAPRLTDQTQEQAWKQQQEWLADKVIGEPQATRFFSVAALKLKGLVGVYTKTKGE